MPRFLRLGPLCLVLALGACGGGGSSPSAAAQIQPQDPPPQEEDPPAPEPSRFPLFRDVTLAAGIDVTAPNDHVYEASGQAWGDVDGDGWVDLYLTRQTGPNVLYRNRGDGTFEISPYSAQVALADRISGGAVFVDYDNDGWKDLYVLAWGENTLFRNAEGAGFVDVTAVAGIGDDGRSESAAWGDYDGDGNLDLYVANWGYAHPPTPEDPIASRDRFYRNRGDGTFEEVTPLLGDAETTGMGFVACFLDYDQDDDLDLYVVNDKGYPGDPPPGTPFNRNVLWRNDGPDVGGWKFTEVAVAAGADGRVDGMGLAVGDIDHDGDEDLYFSDDASSVLLRNRGDGTFEDVSAAFGVDVPVFGWEALIEDFDLDGHADLYLATYFTTNRLWIGDGGTSFTSVEAAAGELWTLGAAACDYDQDGALDLALCALGDTYRLHRNLAMDSTRGHHWLAIRLVGGDGVSRDAAGARVTVLRDDGLRMMKTVFCGSGVGSGNDTTLHFGLGTASAQSVTVRWPDGRVDVLADPPQDAYWTVAR